jgi:ABC-type multidrug transport system fused ATPase/permease subunit
MKQKNFFEDSATYGALQLLHKKDRKKLYLIAFIQTLLGFLDLIGVVAIGALGALSVQGLESHSAGNKVSSFLRILHLQNFSFQQQVEYLGLSAASVLIVKTITSIIFTRKTFFFLSHKGAEISADLMSKVLSLDVLQLYKRTSQEILYGVSEGVKNLTVGILATSVNLIADMFLLIIMCIGLLLVDPSIAIAAIIFFMLVGFILYRISQVRSHDLGVESSQLTVANNQKILEVLSTYRESVVRNRRQFYAREIRNLRYQFAGVMAEVFFMPYASKYVIESASVLGALALAGFEFGTNTAVHAVAVLAVFLAASSRIAPAALRIQQSLIVIKNSAGSSQSVLNLVSDLKDVEIQNFDDTHIDFEYENFDPSIRVVDLGFTYPGNDFFALKNVNFEIAAGDRIAVVGPSGSGKSTLADLLLGVLKPTSGSVKISDKLPNEASVIWPGAISYVPQDIVITAGTIRQNVGLGYPTQYSTNERILKVLDAAQLSSFLMTLTDGIDTEVGEFGNKISGGQKQRLGVARALFTNPKLLILDESTSALDGQTEDELSKAIHNLSGDVTVITIAHRLRTIQSVDKVLYMENGKILAFGTFEEVKNLVPAFEKEVNKLS